MTEQEIFVKLQADNVQMHQEMLQMKQLLDQANAAANAANATAAAGAKGYGGATGTGEDWHMGKGQWFKGGMEGRVVLDEKHFRRCDKFEGNPAKFKSWMFDLITAAGSVDQSLTTDLKCNCK